MHFNGSPVDVLKKAFGLGTTSAPEHKTLRIILCNDCGSFQMKARDFASAARKKGFPIEMETVSVPEDLIDALDRLSRKSQPLPDLFLLDVCGVGERTALRVLEWYGENRPDLPLPQIHFASTCVDMSITEAGRLRRSAGVMASFVDPEEVKWLKNYFTGLKAYNSCSKTLREILNRVFSLDIPTAVEDGYHKESIARLDQMVVSDVMLAWQRKTITAQEAIERLRDKAEGIVRAIRGGFYVAGGKDGLTPDLSFYGSAGSPVKAPVFFTPEAARDYYNSSGEKPILAMQGYDPSVVPLMAQGVIAGIVAASPYMASHLKLLCETYAISGLFGALHAGHKSMTEQFNEEAKPDLPPCFEGATARIGNAAIVEGQNILIAYGSSGLVLNPPASASGDVNAAANVNSNPQLSSDLSLLNQVGLLFSEIARTQGLAPKGVKANISGCQIPEGVRDVGLVRTEQLAVSHPASLAALKRYFTTGDQDQFSGIFNNGNYTYQGLSGALSNGHALKMRLFDFVHSEILDAAEQKQFLDRHGRLDIHGGAALEAWPELYRRQIKCIFKFLDWVNNESHPLEIMMPAVRTEEDVVKAKEMIAQVALEKGVRSRRYSFGVMVETLEACENIAAIAPHCDFISFGTNDLTQQYFEISRGDLKEQAKFTAEKGYNPFQTLAPEIMDLVSKTIAAGRAANPALKADVCGAQAAEVDTAMDLFEAGIDNVSVSPTLENLYALPVLLNYRRFDALAGKTKAPEPAGAGASLTL